MSHPEQGLRVLKHSLRSRLFHWGLILGFMPAAITGFILWLKLGSGDFVNLAMKIHIVGAVIFTVSSLLYVIVAFDRVIAFVRLIWTWDDRDIGWMLTGGGYPQKMLLGKEIDVPPMDKLNSGQKIFGICVSIGGLLLIVTGWILYSFIPLAPKAFIHGADLVHMAFGVFLGLFMFVHIFLGLYNWSEFKAMFGDGTQLLSEVEHHNPLYAANKLERATHPDADEPIGVPSCKVE
jgi:formate dehydrogenase subunit gamma